MKILLPITLLILASTSSYGAFNSNGSGNSNGGGYSTSSGYKTDVTNSGYNTEDRQNNFDKNDIDDANAETSPKGNSTSKAASPTPAAVTKEKEVKPIALVPKSSSDAGKKIQKVTKGDVVSYTWALPSQKTEQTVAEADTQVEIITVSKSGFSGEPSTSGVVSEECKVDSIGINAGSLTYYGSEMPLKDLAKMSGGWIRPWGSESKDIPLDLDDNGYVKNLDSGGALSVISDDKWGRDLEDNKYVLLHDGQGELNFILNKVNIMKKEPGRIEFELPAGRVGISLKATNPADYLRNIRILPLNSEKNNQEISRKKYSDLWQAAGVIRYLNPQRINNSKEVVWNDRQKQTTFGAKTGQSLEDIIQVSNEMKTSPWLLVPHLADDDYFRKMAIYVRDNLNPNLKVYIEYSNETWNWGFKQTIFLELLARENGTTRYLEYGKRAKELFEIWTDVFGGSDRLTRVIGTQHHNSWISGQILKTPGLSELTDALAVGYYVGHNIGGSKADETLTMSEDAIFDYITSVSLPEAKDKLLEQKQVADKYHLELISYEAGQHLVASAKNRENKVLVDKLISLNKHPRMYQLYMDMHKDWKSVGGGLIVWFQTTGRPTKWGSWGLLEKTSQTQSKSPKFQAFKKILSNEGC